MFSKFIHGHAHGASLGSTGTFLRSIIHFQIYVGIYLIINYNNVFEIMKILFVVNYNNEIRLQIFVYHYNYFINLFI
jgi:hypothetical protein